MTTSTDLDFEVFLCPRWCVEKGKRDGHPTDEPEGPGDHFAHVGMVGYADDPDRVDVVLHADRVPNDVGPTRIQLWFKSDGRPFKDMPSLSPAHARSLARWLVEAADKAEGSPHF